MKEIGGLEGGRKEKRRRRCRKRRRRRGRKKTPSIPGAEAKTTASLCVYTNNIRGFTSKQESLNQDVISKLRPDIINLSETLKKNNADIKIKDYFTFSQNRPNGEGGGGIATSVATGLKPFTTKVAGNNEHDKFMVTRIDSVKPALNIVHIYGRIENREAGKPENVLSSWTKISKELRAIEARKECVLICGTGIDPLGPARTGWRVTSVRCPTGGGWSGN